MTTAGEKVQEAASAAADAAAEAAAEMLGKEEDEVLGGAEETGSEGDQWSFFTRALVAVVVIVVCLFATRMLRGESPEEKRQRLRNERRAKKKAEQNGPDEIDRLLSSIVRRQPGQAPPPNSVPIAGRGVQRVVPPGRGVGAAGRGAGSAGAAAARVAAMARAGGRGNGAGPGGGAPPGGPDNRPKLRWDQSNEEVEIVIRVDPQVVRSDVQVVVTSTMLKLSLRNQAVIAGPLFKTVDPEGCNWQIDDPGPGQPKEVMITLLKAEPAKSRDMWWRVPLKGLENRAPARRPQQPTDPEMVRKAIEAIKAKSAAEPGAKLGAKGVSAAVGGQGAAAAAAAGAAAASVPVGAAAGARNGTAAPSTTTPGSASVAGAGGVEGGGGGGGAVGTAAAAAAGGGEAGEGDGSLAPPVVSASSLTAPSKTSSKGSGKKKNRKKK